MPVVLVRKGGGSGGFPAVAPINTVAPAVTGTATVGQVLSTTDGTWAGTPTITFTYQWQRDGVDIGGATASTYLLVAADYTHVVRCVVTAHNPGGSTSANSNATAAVAGDYATVVLADSPVTYWKFNEGSGTSILDYSGNGLTATTHNNPDMSVAGMLTGETGCLMDRNSTQYADAPHNAAMNLGDVFTLEAWVKQTSPTHTMHIYTKGPNTAGFFINSAHLLQIGVHSVANIGDGSITINDTDWHHLVWTKNGATNLIYVDAVEGHGSLSNATASNNSSQCWIGCNSDLSNPMDGVMSHVATYATALSAARILAHFNARS